MASIGIPARSHPVAAEWRIVCAPRVAGVTIPPRSNALRAIALTTPDPLIGRKGALTARKTRYSLMRGRADAM